MAAKLRPLDELRAILRGVGDLAAPERLVLAALVIHAENETATARVRQGDVAAGTGLGLRTVRRALDVLEAYGWIAVASRADPKSRATTYVLRVDDWPERPATAATADRPQRPPLAPPDRPQRPPHSGHGGHRTVAMVATPPSASGSASGSAIPDQPLDPLRVSEPAFALAPVEPIPKATASRAAKQASKAARAHPLPEDWAPTPALYAWALTTPGVELDRGQVDAAVGEMRDRAAAKGTTAVDWTASARTWLRRVRQYNPRLPPAEAPPPRPPPLTPERRAVLDARRERFRLGAERERADVEAEAARTGRSTDEIIRERMARILPGAMR